MYVPNFPPYDHQKEALQRMRGKNAFALTMEMRTGKTKVVLDEWCEMVDDGSLRQLMVIAPAGAYRTWEVAVEDHVSIDVNVFTWVSGPSKSKRDELRRWQESARPKILLMNVEALSSVKAARELCEAVVSSSPTYVAIDESTIIKNPTSKRTKFINSVIAPKARIRRILSGLITPKSPLDLFSQYWFLDPRILDFKSYYSFRAVYGIIKPLFVGGRTIQTVVGYRNLDDLHDKISPYSYRKQLKDCYDVPPKVYLRRDVELTPEQKRIYKEVKAYANAQLAGEQFVTATTVLTQILRLHQVLCGHTKDEQGKTFHIPENRTKMLMEILSDYGGKAIIWCSYDENIKAVTTALEKEYGTVARFWGGNKATREDEEKLFLNDPDCRFMVATPAAGGRGRTWTVADLVIYYSSTPDLEHRQQSEERAQGIGKDDRVTYIDLMTKGSVEEKFIKMLRSKIDISTIINGDNYREWLI